MTTVFQAVSNSPTQPKSVETCKRPLFGAEDNEEGEKGVLFCSRPVRGAIELNCTTTQQNGKMQIKARAQVGNKQ